MKIMKCKHCNSASVMRDAWAQWDVDDQDWVLGSVFDQAYCNACSGETTLVEEEVQGESPNAVTQKPIDLEAALKLHTQNFKAYLDLMTLKDMDVVHGAVHRCWQEQLNGSSGGQRAADKDLLTVIDKLIRSKMESDISILTNRTQEQLTLSVSP